MTRNPKQVPTAELAVLQVLWREGPSTLRELAQELYQGAGASQVATVQKLCERLIQKGFASADRERRPFRFQAEVGRQELIGRELESLAAKLCDGSVAPLISHLMESGSMSAEERRALREKLELPPRKSRKPNKKRRQR